MEPLRSASVRGLGVVAPPLDTPALTATSAVQLARMIAAGEVSAQQVTAAHLQRIADVDRELHALVHLDGDGALAAARRVDSARRRGRPLGPLAGVPVVIKDNIDVRRQTTACGSRAHAGVLALRNARAVARVGAAGAVLLGRANMDELAMGASTLTSAFGPTRNPWDARRSPGGSSGGSAAAVAAGLAPLAIGTDTGGSIREPAAQCGVVGMAPSPGLVPMTGVVPFARELDRVGPLARDVPDTALLLAVLSGRHELAAAGARPSGVRGLRVGVVDELCSARNSSGVLAGLARVRERLDVLGVQTVAVSIPSAVDALETYLHLTSAACVPLLADYVRTGNAGPEVLRRFEIGQALRSRNDGRLAHARSVRDLLRQQTAAALDGCDMLLAPTMPTTAPVLPGPPLDGTTRDDLDDPLAAPYTDCWTVGANLAGSAALSVPAGRCPDDGMPVAVMLSAAAGSDARLLELGAAIGSSAT
ncbi:amidase [uncultured Jatrophihabitans sp.]|uniref:amidase n=1 Tax=uncultured Jatrophihabitans sp. TaxID=1610747 RepID=UPI0035C96720